jgi:hypothetical protein
MSKPSAKRQLVVAKRHLLQKIAVIDTRLCDLTKCIRCGKNHKRLMFKPFQRTPPSEFTHWATCPNTREPIIQAEVLSGDPRLQRLKELGIETELAKS